MSVLHVLQFSINHKLKVTGTTLAFGNCYKYRAMGYFYFTTRACNCIEHFPHAVQHDRQNSIGFFTFFAAIFIRANHLERMFKLYGKCHKIVFKVLTARSFQVNIEYCTSFYSYFITDSIKTIYF